MPSRFCYHEENEGCPKCDKMKPEQEYCAISGSSIKEDTVNITRTALLDLSLCYNALFKENAELKAQLAKYEKVVEAARVIYDETWHEYGPISSGANLGDALNELGKTECEL